MSKLIIKYRDGGGEETSERLITDIVVEGNAFIMAFCHEQQERRAFKIERIASAIDPSTGEIISDASDYFGVRNEEIMNPAVNNINPDEMLRTASPTTLTMAELMRLRTKEKQGFWRRYRYPVIAYIVKRRFFSIFGNKCFKCSSSSSLEMDHHVPMILGGHFVQGNIVALCSRCNNKKRDLHPVKFYTHEELSKLNRLLIQEAKVFEFTLDLNPWFSDRESYLLQLGLEPDLVNKILNNPDHRLYAGRQTDKSETTIKISIDMDIDLSLIEELRNL